MNKKRQLRVGLFGIGLDTYWTQFKGLKPRLESYVRKVQKKLEHPGVEVVNLGLIDNPKKALDAGHKLREADVCWQFCWQLQLGSFTTH
jgi:L-arabinose isomerase